MYVKMDVPFLKIIHQTKVSALLHAGRLACLLTYNVRVSREFRPVCPRCASSTHSFRCVVCWRASEYSSMQQRNSSLLDEGLLDHLVSVL